MHKELAKIIFIYSLQYPLLCRKRSYYGRYRLPYKIVYLIIAAANVFIYCTNFFIGYYKTWAYFTSFLQRFISSIDNFVTFPSEWSYYKWQYNAMFISPLQFSYRRCQTTRTKSMPKRKNCRNKIHLCSFCFIRSIIYHSKYLFETIIKIFPTLNWIHSTTNSLSTCYNLIYLVINHL